MYHEEEVINGVLHYRSSPKGNWTPYTPEELTEKLMRWKNAADKWDCNTPEDLENKINMLPEIY